MTIGFRIGFQSAPLRSGVNFLVFIRRPNSETDNSFLPDFIHNIRRRLSLDEFERKNLTTPSEHFSRSEDLRNLPVAPLHKDVRMQPFDDRNRVSLVEPGHSIDALKRRHDLHPMLKVINGALGSFER